MKYQNGKSKLITKTIDNEKKNETMQLNEMNDETDQDSPTLSTSLTVTTETNKIKTNDFVDLPVVNIITSKVRT